MLAVMRCLECEFIDHYFHVCQGLLVNPILSATDDRPYSLREAEPDLEKGLALAAAASSVSMSSFLRIILVGGRRSIMKFEILAGPGPQLML